MSTKITEKDLASKVVEWLQDQHWDVYQEVQFSSWGGRIADIIAVRGKIVWIIECKVSMSLKVLEQASLWQVPMRSIAILSSIDSMDRHFAYRVAKDYLGLGIISVKYLIQTGTFDRWVIDEEVGPKILREHYPFSQKYILPKLREEHKTFLQAGSKGGGFYTPYKSTMINIRSFINDHPGCTTKEIMDAVGKGHYCSEVSARSGIPHALRDFEHDWCRIDFDGKQNRYYVKDR